MLVAREAAHAFSVPSRALDFKLRASEAVRRVDSILSALEQGQHLSVLSVRSVSRRLVGGQDLASVAACAQVGQSRLNRSLLRKLGEFLLRFGRSVRGVSDALAQQVRHLDVGAGVRFRGKDVPVALRDGQGALRLQRSRRVPCWVGGHEFVATGLCRLAACLHERGVAGHAAVRGKFARAVGLIRRNESLRVHSAQAALTQLALLRCRGLRCKKVVRKLLAHDMGLLLFERHAVAQAGILRVVFPACAELEFAAVAEDLSLRPHLGSRRLVLGVGTCLRADPENEVTSFGLLLACCRFARLGRRVICRGRGAERVRDQDFAGEVASFGAH